MKYQNPLYLKILYTSSTLVYLYMFWLIFDRGYSFHFDIPVKIFMVCITLFFGLTAYLSLIKGYFEITTDEIIIHRIPTKRIRLNDITSVSDTGELVTLASRDKEIRIVRKLINKAQMPDFERFILNLRNKIENK